MVSDWGQGKPSYERTVVKDVQRRKADLAWVGVRVLDTFGIKSFQALQGANICIDSYPLHKPCCEATCPRRCSPIWTRSASSGCHSSPTSCRHPFATKTRLVAPGDFKNKKIRVYASESANAFDAGASAPLPSYEGWADVRDALTRGKLQGLESDLANYVNNEYTNVARFATVNIHTLRPGRSHSSRTPRLSQLSARDGEAGCGKRRRTPLRTR